MKNLTLGERIIPALDFWPGAKGVPDVANRTVHFAAKLSGSGICWLKVEAILSGYGYQLVRDLQARGYSVMADLKLFGTRETLSHYGALLKRFKPNMVTVATASGVDALKAFRDQLPDALILGITVPTSMSEKEVNRIYRTTTAVKVLEFAAMAEETGLNGVVCSGVEVESVRAQSKRYLHIVAVAVRSERVKIKGDDQNQSRVTTPLQAFKAGADQIVLGRQLTQALDPIKEVELLKEEVKPAFPELASV